MIKLLDFLDDDGMPLDRTMLDECFEARPGPPIMVELLCRGAMDLIDPSVVPVAPVGDRFIAVLCVDGARRLSVRVRCFGRKAAPADLGTLIKAGVSLSSSALVPEWITRTNLSRLKPGELARRYDRWMEAGNEHVRPLLVLASAMLLKAGDENIPERPCSTVSFEFDGDSEGTKVSISGMEDQLGRHIGEWLLLSLWKPDLSKDVGWFLSEAVSRYLNRQAPEWRKAPGAGGHLTLTISWNIAGELQAEVSGMVRIWTRTERLLGPLPL